MTRLCYAMDMPRGVRIVRDSITIAEKKVKDDPEGHEAARAAGRSGLIVYVVAKEDGLERAYDAHERLEIDEDTPDRQSRLSYARAVLDAVDSKDEEALAELSDKTPGAMDGSLED